MDERDVRTIVVMGVSGAGKSTIGALLAARLGFEFIEGDDLHSAHDIERMTSGHPLTDNERLSWLNLVGEAMRQVAADGRGAVAACSALKRTYRDLLRQHVPDAFFVLLDGPREVLEARVLTRPRSFMPPSLLGSQIETLEPLQADERGLTVDMTLRPEVIVASIETSLLAPS